MAALTLQRIATAGTAVTTTAAAGGGDTAACGERTFLEVNNGAGAPIDVTIAVPGTDKFGNAIPDLVVNVAAGARKLIPLRAADFADPSTGRANITYSSATSVTVANISL